MKTSRIARFLWRSVFLLLALASVALLAAFWLVRRTPFETAQAFVNLLSSDGSVELFTASGWEWSQPLAQAAAFVSMLLAAGWLVFRKQSLGWLDGLLIEGQRTFQTEWEGLRMRSRGNRSTWVVGLPLFLLFLLVYLAAVLLLEPTLLYRTGNLVFDADPDLVMPAIASGGGEGPKHPLFTLFFSPLGLLLAKMLGSGSLAAGMVNAMFGALCVFLAAAFFLRLGLKPVAATLWATLLGVSTAHLVFSTIPETYIFSASGIILLYLLAAAFPGSLLAFVPAGVYAMGVTVTNLVHALLAFLFSLRSKASLHRFSWGRVATLLLLVLVLTATLNLASIVAFRVGIPYFLPWFYFEQEAQYTTLSNPSVIPQRALNLLESFFVSNLLAPRPYLQNLGEFFDPSQAGLLPTSYSPVSKVTFVPGTLAALPPPGLMAVGLWALLLASAIFGFLRDSQVRSPIAAALGLSLLFNFAFHLLYGLDLFLYAAHWTFPVIALAALALRRWSASPLLLAALVALVGLTAWNNGLFLHGLFLIFR